MLLSSVSVVSIAQVGQALIVGYAVNNVIADTKVVLGAFAQQPQHPPREIVGVPVKPCTQCVHPLGLRS